jgi:HAMP domain-containing protein
MDKTLTHQKQKQEQPPAGFVQGLKVRFTSLKATLAGAILVTVGSTAAIVHVPWLITSQKNVEIVVSQLDEEITRQTTREVGNIFNNVKSTQQLIQNIFLYNENLLQQVQQQGSVTPQALKETTAEAIVDFQDINSREAFYFSILQAVPNFTWVEFGYPNGDFLGLQRGEDGIINVINRRWDPGREIAAKTTEAYRIKGDTLEFVSKEQVAEDYYAPQRPWYKVALETPGEQSWTDVYLFATGRIPGIDSSITLYRGNELQGVISIAFELQQISEFLEELQRDKGGGIFVINRKTELIAFSDPQEIGFTVTGPDTAELKQLQEAQSQYLTYAKRAVQESGVDVSQVNQRQSIDYRDPQTGERFYISLAPLPYLDWLVGTVIPESNYTVAIDSNKRILFFAVSGFILLAAGVAIILADRVIARPIFEIADTAAAIEAESFELERLDRVSQRPDELGQLARVFQTMAQEVYSREQKLKQQVQELKIEIDETKRQKQVSEIVDTDFFKDLQTKARQMRASRQSSSLGIKSPGQQARDTTQDDGPPKNSPEAPSRG